MSNESLQLGRLTILSVLDTTMVGRPSLMWPGRATDEAMEPHRLWLDERGLMHFRIGCFAIRGPDSSLVLVDTGFGGREREPSPGGLRFRPGTMLQGLAAHGIQPRDIEVVLLTHLHIDHVGWNTIDRGGRPALTFRPPATSSLGRSGSTGRSRKSPPKIATSRTACCLCGTRAGSS